MNKRAETAEVLFDPAEHLPECVGEIRNHQTDLPRIARDRVLEEFQKYVSQASVEPYAIKRRNQFLDKAFEHYLDPRTKGKIIRRVAGN